MAKVDTYRCDVCEVQKRETNHWFVVSTEAPGYFAVRTWENAGSMVKSPSASHVCGLECATKLLARWAEAAA
jgi:hypothetical protein